MYLSVRINSQFQKFFSFWVAGIILEAWDVALESAHFLLFKQLEKTLCTVMQKWLWYCSTKSSVEIYILTMGLLLYFKVFRDSSVMPVLII